MESAVFADCGMHGADVIDIAFTLMALDCWYGRMAGQPQDSPVAMWFSERYSDAYMANRFQTMHIDPSKAGRM